MRTIVIQKPLYESLDVKIATLKDKYHGEGGLDISRTKLVSAILTQGLSKHEAGGYLTKEVAEMMRLEHKPFQLAINIPGKVEDRIKEIVAEKKMTSISDGIRYLLALATMGA